MNFLIIIYLLKEARVSKGTGIIALTQELFEAESKSWCLQEDLGIRQLSIE